MYAVHTVHSVHCDMIWSAYYAPTLLHAMYCDSIYAETSRTSTKEPLADMSTFIWWTQNQFQNQFPPIVGDNGHHINMQEPWIICKYSKHQLMIHNRVPIV